MATTIIESTRVPSTYVAVTPPSTHHILMLHADTSALDVLRPLASLDALQVTRTSSLANAGRILATCRIDLVLVHGAVQSVSVVDVCHYVRAWGRMPLVIAAPCDVQQRIAALRSGADDVVVSDDPTELQARIRALLRRFAKRSNVVGAMARPDLYLNLDRSTVTLVRSARTVALTPDEMRLLHFLATNAGCTLSRPALTIRVWASASNDMAELLDATIASLRAKIERDPSKPELVRGGPGNGFGLRIGAD